MSAGVFALAFVPALALALPVLFAIGVGTLALLGATNTLIQTLSPDDVRGRALSIYTMIAIGVVPLGALVDGAIAALIGLRATFALGRGALHSALSCDLVLAPDRSDGIKKASRDFSRLA